MDASLPGRMFFNKLSEFVEQLIQKRQGVAPSQVMDVLHQEIHQIEQNLSNMSTRPSRAVRKTRSTEPMTEQQKIIDLAG